MPEVVDLSQFKSKAQPEQDFPKLEDLSEEEQERIAALAAEAEPELHTVTTAFVVFVNRDGTVVATGDLGVAATLSPDRVPSLDDIYGASASVQKSLSAQETSARTTQMTLQNLMALQQQAMQRAQEQQILQQVQPHLHR